MQRIVLTRGLIAGAILSAVLLGALPFQDAIGFNWGMVLGYTSMVVAFLLIYFGVRAYRDTVGGGTIRFGRAFVVGALIGVVASLCYVAAWEVIYFKLAPNYLEKVTSHTIEGMRADGASEAAIAAKQVELGAFAAKYDNLLFNAALTFVEPLPVALIVALVSAGVLRRGRGSRAQYRPISPDASSA